MGHPNRYYMMRNHQCFWLFTGSIFFLINFIFTELAIGSPSFINLQSRISKPEGNGYLESNSVQFRMTVTDPLGTCILFQEEFANVDMTGSKGLINFKIGAGSKIYPVGPLDMPALFTNFNSPLYNCQAGGTYTAASTDSRKLVMQFNDGSGWQTVPSMEINSVPFSLESLAAHKLGLYPAADYVRSAQFTSCTGTEAVHFNGTNFTCVALSSGASYSAITGATGTNTIDNTNYAQTWNWSTATTQNPMTMTANALTTGSLLNLTTSNNSLNSTSGLLNVTNTGTSTNGVVARIQSNSTAGSGLTVLANGNVGVGTATPTATLEVIGTSVASGNAPKVLNVVGGNTNSGAPGTGGAVTFAAGGRTGVSAGGVLNLAGGNENGGGGSSTLTGGAGGNGWTGGSVILTGGITGAGSNPPGSISIGGGVHGASTNGTDITILAGARAGTGADGYVLLATTRGNVGIGTTTPAEKLVVSGQSAFTGKVAIGQSSINSAGYLHVRRNTGATGDDNLFLDNAEFGAGKTSTIMFTTGGSGYSRISGGESTAGSGMLAFGTGTGGPITEKMRIGANGNVGVGTTTPAEKLEINGGVKIGTTATTNAGTIRWDGTNFSGYTGAAWVHFVPSPPGAGVCDSTLTYTTPGTYAYTVPATFGSITIRIWGGGGAGGYVFGSEGPITGNQGGTTSVASLGLTAHGGEPGRGANATGAAGSGSSLATGGDINTAGNSSAATGAAGVIGSGAAAPNGGSGGVAGNGVAGQAPGGGGSGSLSGGASSSTGGGSGAYLEKTYNMATLIPGTTISDLVVAAGGSPVGSYPPSGRGGDGRISIACSSVGTPIPQDRSIIFYNGSSHDTSSNFVFSSDGNVGIGTVSPGASSLLDLSSTTKGFVLPRMTKAQRDLIATPVAGMVIYQTDNTPGLRVYNGTNWMRFTETID